MMVSHFVSAGSFLIRYSDDHMYIMCYSWHVLYRTYCFYCGFMER